MTQTPNRSPIGALCTLLTVAFMAVALSGCHNFFRRALAGRPCNKPQIYSTAQSIPPLKVPAGIDPPDTHSSLRIPPLNEPAPPPRKLTDSCLDAPPSFAASGPPGGTKSVPSL